LGALKTMCHRLRKRWDESTLLNKRPPITLGSAGIDLVCVEVRQLSHTPDEVGTALKIKGLAYALRRRYIDSSV